MKALQKFLNARSSKQPAKGSLGAQTDWLPVLEMELGRKGFLISDFQFVPSRKDGLIVKLPAVLYSIEAKGMSYGSDRRIAGLRVVQKEASGTRGKKIGKTWVDTGLTSVCDFERVSKEWKALGKDAEQKLKEEYGKAADCGVLRLSKKRSPILYVSSGFGDGTFPVFELRDGAKRVGFEIEMPDSIRGRPKKNTWQVKPLGNPPSKN